MNRRLVALLACWLALTANALADCKVHKGENVVLYSTTENPSVLIWDSRARLRDYHAASFDAAQAMLPHALLAAPGTHASVIACIPNSVTSPLFSAPDDAIGVIITAGPYRGAARWVLGSDVRPEPKR
ncbi:MAG TPA: hypothetical protein VGX91_00385 [Candidatus Cybelea sp.]|nr:hypothetical protein [Candidatus Cybelea sp.]